ncbi:MAG: PASTA domain-containing protein [Actinobacteria bacterium]|nr:PASTA domain-containing protein [Actinomycetota bacterium]
MSEPQNMPGTVLSGRYQLDQLRVESAGSSTGVLQYDATDLSSLEAISVRIVALSQLIDPALGSTTPDDALAAFEQQFDIASSLRHPCIESVLDHGEVTLEGERYVFVVGERLAGGSLREFLDRGRRLTPSQALIVGIDICRALDAAAKQGISHSDLRPSRLVFGLDRRVRLVGFGAPLRPLDALGLEQATYSAPELAEGGARSASSDVYSLALILVESMTGDVPFAGETVAVAFANRLGKLLPVNADFGALAQVLEHAGRPTASERFSPREFGQALVQSAENLPRPTPIDVVGTGLFDAEVAVTDPSQPIVRPDISQMPPVENVAPNEPILIRTTPKFGGSEVIDTPTALIVTEGTTGTPLTIGGDDTGPIAMDADSLRVLAAEDPTSQVVRPKKRWGRRIAIGLVVVALIAGASVAAYFTVLNPKNPVPALVGLTEAEARNQVSPFGWGITVVKERSDSVQAGQIIRTDPVLGANLAKRDGITMVVSEGPTLSVLTELTGLTADDAKAKLAELGLEAAPVDTADEAVAIGTVVSWTVPDQPTLKVGDSVVKGTTVAINVSTGPAMREVPNLLGMTLEAATAKLTELGLVVVEAPAMGSPDVPAGQISVQVPVAAEKLAKDGTVTVTVSKGQTTTLIPTIYGKDLATVKERLLKYGMVIGKVTGNTKRGLRSALVDGKIVKNYARVIVGKTVDLVFP